MPARSGETWSSPEGLHALRDILKSLIPQWENGPYDWQVIATARILDKRKQLVVAACGEGKTALSYLHLLVIQELIRRPDLPRFGLKIPAGLQPVVLMVTPLSDLGISQVAEMEKLGIKATTLDAQMVLQAKSENKQLLRDVRDCKYSVVIVSPERLKTRKFDKILRDEKFRKNLVLYVIDECHVVIPWSKTFRECYGDVGQVCARIPPDVPVLAMTATSQPGATERSLLRLLGFRAGEYAVMRRSCERANLRIVFQTLSHGLGPQTTEFPDLDWVARGSLKTVIYVKSIELGNRVKEYLYRRRPPGSGRARNIRTYNALWSAKKNAQVLHAFETDPETFVVIATIKFGMGIDVRAAQVCINLGLPESAEMVLQQIGRAGRQRTMDAMGVTYVE
ncbi:P-loop containing nucleoside triphosphate hydrolase protein, partial [Auriscalpium vulgare]